MAIIMRNGLAADFDPAKMRTGELAVVTDSKELHVTFSPGDSPKVVLDGEAIPTPSVAGTNGQVLKTDENGDAVWDDVASPTDAQVEEAVSDWLDAHPEATTTVQDGAITYAKLDSNLKGTVDDVGELKSEITSKVDYLANNYINRVYPTWESGGINSETGEDNTLSYTRTNGYIPKADIALWSINEHSGALYVYRYNYSEGVYTYLGRNQRTSTGTFTSWIKGLEGTHFRFAVLAPNATPNDWMTLCINTVLNTDITNGRNLFAAVKEINIGSLNKMARELLISILQGAIFNSDLSTDIARLNRYLIEPGEMVITETGKQYSQNGGVSNYEYSCITEFYPIDNNDTSIVFYYAIDDISQLGRPTVLLMDANDAVSNYVNMANSGRQNVEYAFNINETIRTVGFTLNIASVQKSYAYSRPSGNLLFAGSESKYFGLKNIKQYVEGA